MKPSALLAALQDRRAFIVFKVVPREDGKTDKIPVDPYTGANADAQNPAAWMLLAEAELWAGMWSQAPLPPGVLAYGAGIVITEDSGLFCLDLDACRDGDTWLPHAASFCARFPGAYVEVSLSGNGLHIIGRYAGTAPPHGTRNKTFRMELYTRRRFIALTGENASGDALSDHTAALQTLAADFFPQHDDSELGLEWTSAPVPQWHGPTDDAELIARARRSGSAAAWFGGRVRFEDLWTANETALTRGFPAQTQGQAWDGSAADLALCNHLAFWTGSDCDRMWRLMQQSALRRDKWGRSEYVRSTVLRACSSQREWYNDGASAGAVESTQAVTPGTAPSPVPAGAPPPPPPDLTVPPAPLAPGRLPPPGDYIGLDRQFLLFSDMAYVADINKIQLPTGETLDQARFDNIYGGREYAMTRDNQKPSKSAWEAFTRSQLHDFPKVAEQFFDPRMGAACIVEREGRKQINSYVPVAVPRIAGDAGPFIRHVHKLLPNGQDAWLLIWYFAALVQHPGVKFQWWPLIQGVEGNGKTVLSKFVRNAVGRRFTHWPKTEQLGSKFNAPFYGKILVCVEDVFIAEAKGSLWEALKPMITGTELEVEAKGVDKVMRDVCFNGILNTNHKDGLRKTRNDRRIMPLFCAQQYKADLERDGITIEYFREFQRWRRNEGGPIVSEYLATLTIPDEYNPATFCTVPPITTSTEEAIEAGYGAAEQELLEVIAQGLEGFRNGWICSTAVDQLLSRMGKDKAIPRRNRRAVLVGLGYEPHPAFKDGRSTVKFPDGSQPIVYIRRGHEWSAAHLTGAQVLDGYLKAQKQ